MKIIIKYCISAVAVALFISCSNTVNKGLWQSQPLLVNEGGNRSLDSFKSYDSESELYYTISNDLDNLYFSIKTNNQKTQMRILRSGIEFCIDTAGKYSDRTKILFPFAVLHKKNNSASGGSYGADQSSGHSRNHGINQKPETLELLKKKFTDADKTMHLIGFKTPIGGAVPLPNDYGIKMNISWDTSNTMIYQASIPFVTFYKKLIPASDSAKIFGISMNLNGLPVQQSPYGMRPMGGGGISMGMGGMGGMGMGFGVRMPMGGTPGMGNPAYQQTSSTKIKMKIKLALKPDK